MTFEHWIRHVARAGDNPRGDFIRDSREFLAEGAVVGNYKRPARWEDGEVTSLNGLRSKMREVGEPCDRAYEEAKRCWRQYRRAIASQCPASASGSAPNSEHTRS